MTRALLRGCAAGCALAGTGVAIAALASGATDVRVVWLFAGLFAGAGTLLLVASDLPHA